MAPPGVLPSVLQSSWCWLVSIPTQCSQAPAQKSNRFVNCSVVLIGFVIVNSLSLYTCILNHYNEAEPHHQHRSVWIHWSTCCQRDHISAKTVHARPRVENATFSRRLQSHLYQDIPSDWRIRPGRPRQSWLATIHRDLQQLDIGLDNVPELAANRLLWRGLICGTTHHSGACYRWW